MHVKGHFVVIYKKKSQSELSMLKQRTSVKLIGILDMLNSLVIVLFLLTSVAGAQSVQGIDTEAQLALVLCRNPKDDATSELLLNKNAHLVNVTLLNALLDCASSAQRQQSPAKSTEIYKLALRVADRLNKPELLATAYYYLGRTYSLMSDFENSIQAYETSRKLFEQSGIEGKLIYVLADLGALYFTVEDYEMAQSYSEQSLAIADRMKLSSSKASLGPIAYGQARSLHTLGAIDLSRGNQRTAIKKLGEALALYERLDRTGPSYNISIAEALITLAKVYGEMGEYGRAFSYLTKAHQVSRSSGDKNTSANIMSSQATLFLEQEDYSAAETYFNKSLRIYRSLGNARQEARVLLNLAMLEQRQGNHNDALQLFERTMERAQTTNLIDVQIGAGEGLGVVLTAKRDFPNALNAINQSLEIARRVNAKSREVELLWRAAQTYHAMQNYRDSAELAEQALTLARSLQLPKLTYFATAELGEAYAADGKVELAITTLKNAITQVEEMRDEVVGRQESRQLFFENKVGPYHTLVKLLIEQGKNFEALLYAERAKGRVLLEAVRNNRTDLENIYTQSERIEAELLISKLSAVRQQMQAESDGEAKQKLQDQLDAVRRELASFQETLSAAHPELLLRAGPANPLTHGNLNTLIPADDFAYLEYVITGDDVGIFILKRNGVTTDHDLKYVKLPVNADELRQKVDEFHSVLADRHPDYRTLGRQLYRLLIEPAANELETIRTVCIISDGFLWTLPFQALTTTRGNYLIQEYSLYYAPSLSVLNEMTLRTQQKNIKESLIAFGNPVIERNGKLNRDLHPLPEAETEVAAIAATVRTEMKTVLVGREADERTFKALAPQYTTIHLATHGVLDNRDPLNSHLLLTKTDDETENEGSLEAREIIDMHLEADLAVLSACETGNGRISPGEGVIGMSWAFLVAGARSVVVSQWRVNSASTSQLMKNFYQALARQKDLKGPNKSQALRDASLHLLKDRRYRHPFYWAGFVLVSSN
jgi:CHAT domain-containing protein